MQTNDSLLSLHLSGTGLTDHSARQLAGVVRLNSTLKELHLRSLHHQVCMPQHTAGNVFLVCFVVLHTLL